MTEKLEACTVLRVFNMRDECIAFRLNFGLFSIWQQFSMPAQRCFTGGQCFIHPPAAVTVEVGLAKPIMSPFAP
ncbi:hypothetical protein OKW41_008498 [Paraburkholderia sp. UCT70]|uniref:hypothetical protein n=1 Tax=Paraburkholderia sp. UCT70 TaxID=2991068 RepID=UPI003D1FC681